MFIVIVYTYTDGSRGIRF